MWEAIRANQRRSIWLIALMGVTLAALGAVLGLAAASYLDGGGRDYYAQLIDPRAGPPPTFWQTVIAASPGAWFGIAGALVVWLILWLTALGGGDGIILRSAKAREIAREDHPQLWNVVEEMTIASGIGRMPRVFIIDDPAPNAFAVGRKPEAAAVAVTSGLLKRLSRDELQGVVAHEIGHIRNLDVRFMTLASVMVGAIVLISHGFLRGLFYSGGRRRSSRGGGQAQLVLLAVAILLAILAPIAAQILYFACSRRREFLADASAARFTRYPAGLAGALEKIAHNPMRSKDVNRIVAPMYIVNPLQSRSLLTLFATHPPTEKRVAILRGMGGAGYAAYEAAFQRVAGTQKRCLGEKTLAGADEAGIRSPLPEPARQDDPVKRAEAVGNLLDRLSSFLIIPCACGVKLKLPPKFKRDTFKCPRCGRAHDRSAARPAGGGGAGRSAGASADEHDPSPEPAQAYRRKGTGWESFECACGQPIELSPKFKASSVACSRCGRTIAVSPAAD